jgi:hypothetical protein
MESWHKKATPASGGMIQIVWAHGREDPGVCSKMSRLRAGSPRLEAGAQKPDRVAGLGAQCGGLPNG